METVILMRRDFAGEVGIDIFEDLLRKAGYSEGEIVKDRLGTGDEIGVELAMEQIRKY